ncbi:uridine kinase family protein [Virgibacillus sp. MG-45]|uniref:uridine kinase family protein n=1 Tax=Virgibacillus sp. MG-45 TaxID=3102791 RepID=UPI002EDA73AD
MDEILQRIANLINEKENRIIIGISGHGASGKTTFSNKLMKLLKQNDINYMNTDPYIIGSNLRKYAAIDYEFKQRKHHYRMTACHPAAHNLLALERDINMIREGLDLYTIETHYMESTLLASHNNVTIVEGMSVAFCNPDLFDLTIYFYTDGETEFMRRSDRDVSERGADINYLRDSHKERRIQYELFMHPYHQYFDIVIRNSNEAVIVEKNLFNQY